jgi:hypothetical protein
MISNQHDTVEAFIDHDGSTYLWVKPRYGQLKITTTVPQKLFLSESQPQFTADGRWHDTPEPLDYSKGAMFEHIRLDTDYFLVETKGPALTSPSTPGSGYTPSTYRTVARVPYGIKTKTLATQHGQQAYSADAVIDFERKFWDKYSLRAWKWIKTYLPDGLPDWEMNEAKNVWVNSHRSNGYIAATSLASARRNYARNKHYYFGIMGLQESTDDKLMRQQFNREARLMASFYRMVTNLHSREELLRRTKIPAAKRLAGTYATGIRAIRDSADAQYDKATQDVNDWISTARLTASP